MTDDLISRKAEDVMYDLGVRFAHSSGDDGLPDVGMSLGLGGAMLYAGEVPGKDRPGWWLAIYPKDGEREDIGQLEDMKADTLMDAISAAMATMIPRAEVEKRVEGLRAVKDGSLMALADIASDRDAARKRVEELEQQLADVLAREAEAVARHDAKVDRLEAEAEAMVAAAFETAKEAVANLPTGASEDVMEGQEQAYRALEALATADQRAALDRLIADKVAEATTPKPLAWEPLRIGGFGAYDDLFKVAVYAATEGEKTEVEHTRATRIRAALKGGAA